MRIKLTFLGTGQAIPTIRRNHTSILLEYKDENILIDCGEGTQRQIRKAKINPCKLTRILITHWHGDHILGLPGLLQTLALNGYNRKLKIYGPRGTKKYFSLIMDMFIFTGKLDVEITEVSEGKFLETKEFYIEAREMRHGAPCLAYSFVEKDKKRIDKKKMKKLGLKEGPLIGKLKNGETVEWKCKKIKPSSVLYEEEGKKISFILDTQINENCFEIAKNSELLICEATYSKEDKEKALEYRHLTAEDAGNIAKKAKVKKLVLMHLSQRYEGKEKVLLNEARKIFKNTEIMEDLTRVEV